MQHVGFGAGKCSVSSQAADLVIRKQLDVLSPVDRAVYLPPAMMVLSRYVTSFLSDSSWMNLPTIQRCWSKIAKESASQIKSAKETLFESEVDVLKLLDSADRTRCIGGVIKEQHIGLSNRLCLAVGLKGGKGWARRAGQGKSG